MLCSTKLLGGAANISPKPRALSIRRQNSTRVQPASRVVQRNEHIRAVSQPSTPFINPLNIL